MISAECNSRRVGACVWRDNWGEIWGSDRTDVWGGSCGGSLGGQVPLDVRGGDVEVLLALLLSALLKPVTLRCLGGSAPPC